MRAIFPIYGEKQVRDWQYFTNKHNRLFAFTQNKYEAVIVVPAYYAIRRPTAKLPLWVEL